MDVWLLAAVLVVALPILGWHRFRRYVALPGPVPTARKLRAYASILLTQWTLVAACAWVLGRHGLDLGALGVGVSPPLASTLTALVIGAVLCATTVRGVRGLAASPDEELPSHLRHVVRILPETPSERVAFTAVALTAGFCEEVLYRGFLLYALDEVVRSPWLSLALAASAFGVGHAYQGRRGVALTAALGVVFGVLYRYGGSLWPAIALHVGIDLVNGFALGALARRRAT